MVMDFHLHSLSFHRPPGLKTAEHPSEERCPEDLGLGIVEGHLRFHYHLRHHIHAILRGAGTGEQQAQR